MCINEVIEARLELGQAKDSGNQEWIEQATAALDKALKNENRTRMQRGKPPLQPGGIRYVNWSRASTH